MTLQDFINKYNGQKVGYDGVAADVGQCVQLDEAYLNEVYGMGGMNLPGPTAYQIYENYNGPLHKFPSSGTPQPGALIFWDTKWGAGAGHTAIVVTANPSTFTCFEQNDGDNGLAHVGEHNYTDVVGWLGVPQTNQEEEMTNQGDAVNVVKLFDGDEHDQALINQLTNQAWSAVFYNYIQGKVEALQRDKATDDGIANERAQQIDQLNQQINALNVQIAQLSQSQTSQPSQSSSTPVSPQLQPQPSTETPVVPPASTVDSPTPPSKNSPSNLSLWQRIVKWLVE